MERIWTSISQFNFCDYEKKHYKENYQSIPKIQCDLVNQREKLWIWLTIKVP